MGADSLTYALTGLKHLRSLNLAGMGEVGDVLLTEAALALPLREITLSRCATGRQTDRQTESPLNDLLCNR